jgi:hypothetical protein
MRFRKSTSCGLCIPFIVHIVFWNYTVLDKHFSFCVVLSMKILLGLLKLVHWYVNPVFGSWRKQKHRNINVKL